MHLEDELYLQTVLQCKGFLNGIIFINILEEYNEVLENNPTIL